MAYQVLYRTYRPHKFSEVVGQEYIIKTLKNAIKTDRIAHAYLFAGPRGTGKTTIAKIFARAINCQNFEEECCGICPSCLMASQSNNPDIIELDAASNNSVDDIRDIVEKVAYMPVGGRYKVYIIDEVHMLSTAAFNALLKTLEEPPAHVIFILATTDPQKIIPTVLSRCQRYNFTKISRVDMKKKMKEICEAEGLEYEEKALEEIAIAAEGGMRDALSICEQVLSYNNKGFFLDDVSKIFGLTSTEKKVELLTMIHSGQVYEAVKELREMYLSGIDPKRLAADLLEIIKEVLLYSQNGSDELLEKLTGSQAQVILSATNVDALFSDVEKLQNIMLKLRVTQSFINYLELAFMQMSAGVVKETVAAKPLQKEEKKPVVTKAVEPAVEKPSGYDDELLLKILLTATKEAKINDEIIFNRLEMYRLEPDKRKFYSLLINTKLYASNRDALVVLTNSMQAAAINDPQTNEELYNFTVNEYGIDKVIFAIDDPEREKLVAMYRATSPEERANATVEIRKYEIKREPTKLDKLKDLFGNVRVEE